MPAAYSDLRAPSPAQLVVGTMSAASSGGGAGGRRPDWSPPPGWPALGELTYIKEAITTLFLVLALPYVAYKLVSHPGQLLGQVGRKHTKP